MTTKTRKLPRKSAPPEQLQEAARVDVLAQLKADAHIKRAFDTRFEGDGTLMVALGILDVATGELRIPDDWFNQACLDDYAMISACFEGRG